MSNVPAPSGGGGGGGTFIPTPSMDMGAVGRGEYAPSITVQIGDKTIDEIVLTSMLNNQKNGRLFDVAGGL
jgi:hypothetical protein